MADDFRFVPVEELDGDPPLIIGLSGMSDSGKTYSALLIAQAIARARGGIVAAIDTEGRMKKYRDSSIYAELHPFKAMRWTPPFEGDRAIRACQAAIKAGAACIILDSASDEWEGEGGVLQSQEAHLAKLAGNDYKKRERMNMPAWAKAKSPHQRWHSFLLGLSVPIILCHRARPKIKMVKSGGKTEIVDAGIQPICDTRLVYDMMFHLLMDESKRDGSYTVLKGGYKHERGVFPPGGKVDADAIGRLLAVTSDARPAGRWERGPDHAYYWQGEGDMDSPASRKALFVALKTDLNGPESDARSVAAANRDAIACDGAGPGAGHAARHYRAAQADGGWGRWLSTRRGRGNSMGVW